MTQKVATVVVLFLGVSLAGCLGGGDADSKANLDTPSTAGPAEFDEDTGAVRGVVLSEEQLPVVGAEILLFGAEREWTTRSAADGAFSISNVPPGGYQLAAQRLGYDQATRSVQVSKGDVTDVELVLVAIPIPVPWIQSIPHVGYIGTAAAFVRSTTCSECGTEDTSYFLFDGFPDDYKGVVVEAVWNTQDWLAFDLNQRGDPDFMWYRTRGQSPVHYFVEPCKEYPDAFGRNALPCTEEEIKVTQQKSAEGGHLETWYVGLFQEETHTLDPVCQQPLVLPGYAAGCYGVGAQQDLTWETWITFFHLELPHDAETYSALGR